MSDELREQDLFDGLHEYIFHDFLAEVTAEKAKEALNALTHTLCWAALTFNISQDTLLTNVKNGFEFLKNKEASLND